MSFKCELHKRFFQEEKNEYMGLNKIVNRIQPLVSVSVATYQHKNFIRECLDGILMQKTNFSFEIIIGDDGSDDGTTEICKEYATKYPDIIRLFIRDRNSSHYYEDGNFIGRFNGIWCRMSCRGKYIALCEGDDYWTDPLKLQKQVDFLENNPDFIFSMGRYKRLYEDSKKIFENKEKVNLSKTTEFEVSDYLKFKFSQTATFVYRNIDIIIPDWFSKVHAGDQSLVVIYSKFGKIKVHNEFFSVYRINPASVTFTNSARKIFVTFDETLSFWNEYLDYKYERIIFYKKLLNCIDYLIVTSNGFLKQKINKLFLKFLKKAFNVWHLFN